MCIRFVCCCSVTGAKRSVKSVCVLEELGVLACGHTNGRVSGWGIVGGALWVLAAVPLSMCTHIDVDIHCIQMIGWPGVVESQRLARTQADGSAGGPAPSVGAARCAGLDMQQSGCATGICYSILCVVSLTRCTFGSWTPPSLSLALTNSNLSQTDASFCVSTDGLHVHMHAH
jgi:hypothetical protein